MFTGIALFYAICTAVGFIFALLGAIFGELHGFGGGSADSVDLSNTETQIGGPDSGLSSITESSMPVASIFNTITLSTFVGFFGISGLIVVWALGLGPAGSLMFAFPVALIIAISQFLLYVKYFVKAQASSEATLEEIIGSNAEVITTIPEGRIGEIAYVIKESRYTAPAKSSDGIAIACGTSVIILEFKNNIAIVQPFT